VTERQDYTPQDLREGVRAAEIAVSLLNGGTGPDKTLELLGLLDRIALQLDQLEERGVDLRAERGQIEALHKTLVEKGRFVIASLATRGGIEAQRTQAKAGEERWWWFLDRILSQRRSQRVRRKLWMFGGIAAALAVLSTLYMLFWRPDEATRLQFQYAGQAESLIDEGEFEAALEQYELALGVAPDDAEINLMVGLMYEALGRPEQAEPFLSRAQELYGSPAAYLAIKSQRYLMIGWVEESEAVALQSVAEDDRYALGFCSLGSVYEVQGRVPEAIVALQQCADLAREQGQDEIYVIAASRLAMLMQMPVAPDPDLANTPEQQDTE
jgi:tetratricopeptide (TPR) repeat protein